MGIDYAAARKLIQLSRRVPPSGEVLMLGRHRMQVRDRLRPALDTLMAEEGMGLTFADLEQDDGYTETFFRALGYDAVSAMDLSDFEGATVLHDLNDKVPAKLKKKFALIYDGGTTEHVFDVATCMANINAMLAPGGILAACAPGNNFFAHGFYQFGPELVYGYWKHGCGFDVLTCSMLPEWPRDKELDLPDPAQLGHRIRLRGKVPNQRVYLYYEVQKGPNAHAFKAALQTDYVKKWSDHDRAEDREDSDIVALYEKQTMTGDDRPGSVE